MNVMYILSAKRGYFLNTCVQKNQIFLCNVLQAKSYFLYLERVPCFNDSFTFPLSFSLYKDDHRDLMKKVTCPVGGRKNSNRHYNVQQCTDSVTFCSFIGFHRIRSNQ